MPNAPRAYSTDSVSSRVRAELIRQGRSQMELAALLELNQAAISRRLTGKIEFSASELASVSTWLDVPVASFFGEGDSAQGGSAA